MMEKQSVFILAIVSTIFFFGLPKAKAYYYFMDGETHDVDYAIDDYVGVHNKSASGHGFGKTTVNFLSGASISGSLSIWDDSEVNILGGQFSQYVTLYHSGKLNISGGSIAWSVESNFEADGVHITVLGGEIRD